MKNKLLLIILVLLLIPIAVAWTPSSDIVMRNRTINDSWQINATAFYQDGNKVIDSGTGVSTANYSSYSNYSTLANYSSYANYSDFSDSATTANSSEYWDDLDEPRNITQVGTLVNLTVTNNVTANRFKGFVDWSYLTNKFITAVDGIYIYMVGTTATLNETKLNETIDIIVIASNISMETYVNATFQKEITPNTCSGSDFINEILDNGSLSCGTPAGSGTITAVLTNSSDNWLGGNTVSGDADLTFNKTLLNTTIDTRVNASHTGSIAINITNNVWDLNTTYTNTLYYTQSIIDTLGNWTADKSDYYTSAVVDTLGNWSADEGNYYNTTQSDALTYPASQVTTGTFGTGNYIMDTNLTVEYIKLETNSTNHYITDNSTHIIIQGQTSSIIIG